MSRHLSERQMSEWVLGERGPDAEKHVGECAHCREAVNGAALALAAFRGSARQWSEEELGAAADSWKTDRARPWITFRSLRWAAVAAMVLVLTGVSVMWRNTRPAAQDSAAADAALLQQIDADVSQTVPGSMAPLVKLVSWNGEPVATDKLR
jgi:hypothetical protein